MANKLISDLTAVATPALTDEFEIEQGGVSYKMTSQQIKDLVLQLNTDDWEEQVACGNIAKGWSFEDHFNGNSLANWSLAQSGGGEYPVTTQTDSNLDYLGEARFRLTTNAGYFNAFAVGSVQHGNFYGLGKMVTVFRLNIPIFGSSNTGKYQFGLVGTSVAADADQVNGLYFEYDIDQSVNWRYCGAKASARNKNTSSVAVSGTTITAKIVASSDWSSVEFFINGVSLGTISNSNYIPTAAVGIGICGYKRALTSAYTGYIDLVKAWQTYNTPLTF